MITYRRADKDDGELFRSVRLKALLESPEAFGSTYEAACARDHGSWEEQIQSTVDGVDRNTRLAFSRGECVGIAAIYREPQAPSGDLIMMWVEPGFRGTQVAGKLVSALLDWARSSGFEAVGLGVNTTNERAIRFYKAQGFQLTGETFDVDPDRSLRGIRMTKKLRQSGRNGD